MNSSDDFSPPIPQEPILETAALQQLEDILGDQASIMLPDLLDDFFKDSIRLIADARCALEQKNAPDLRRCAHSLKSNGATYGAMALSAAAKELETLAREGIFDGAQALIDRSAREFEKIKPLLEQYRQGR